MYKAIIFDWDGTLVDTCDMILNAHNHVREHYKLPLWTMDNFLGEASKSTRENYPKIYKDESDNAQKLLYNFFEDKHLDFLEPINDAKKQLDRLEKLNIPMGIVSNKKHHLLLKEINHLNWENYFQTAIGAGHAEKDKPDSAPLNLAIKNINPELKNNEILYIGDTETDLLTAKNTQCDVALIPSDKPRPDLINKYSPQYAADDLTSAINQSIDRIQT